MRAGHELLREVLGIGDDGRDHEPLGAIRRGKAIEELGQSRVLAVRHAIASQPSTTQLSRHDLEIAKARRLLDYQPRYTSLQGIFESVNWLISQEVVKTASN